MSVLSELREAIRAALPIPDALSAYGYEGRIAAGGYRFNSCPSCGDGSSGKFWAKDEVCHCHSCGFSGDVFAVVGAIHDLSPTNHFAKIRDIAAGLAGIDGDYDRAEVEGMRRRREEMRERDARQRALKAAKISHRVTGHGLRRTFNELASQSDKIEITTRAITGHSDVGMQEHYREVPTAEKRELQICAMADVF